MKVQKTTDYTGSVYKTVFTILGFVSPERTLKLAIDNDFNIIGLRKIFLNQFPQNKKIKYINKTTIQDGVILGYLLNNETKIIYLGIQTEDKKIIEIPFVTKRKDLDIVTERNDERWSIIIKENQGYTMHQIIGI